MTTERFLNTYQNASTVPSPDVPADLASFMLAADPVLAEAAELARILARAHQGAATQPIGEGWAHVRKYFSSRRNTRNGRITEHRPRDSVSTRTHTRSAGRSA
jgi:hypothetical protein